MPNVTFWRSWVKNTEILAPHAGLIASRNAEVGEWVTPGAPLLELLSLDVSEVRVSLPDAALPLVDLPFRGAVGPGPAARVTATLGPPTAAERWNWEGRSSRWRCRWLSGSLSPPWSRCSWFRSFTASRATWLGNWERAARLPDRLTACGETHVSAEAGQFSRWGRGARLTRRVREEYRVYSDRNATMSGAVQPGWIAGRTPRGFHYRLFGRDGSPVEPPPGELGRVGFATGC